MTDLEKNKTNFYKEIKKILKQFRSGSMSKDECFEEILKTADEVFD